MKHYQLLLTVLASGSAAFAAVLPRNADITPRGGGVPVVQYLDATATSIEDCYIASVEDDDSSGAPLKEDCRELMINVASAKNKYWNAYNFNPQMRGSTVDLGSLRTCRFSVGLGNDDPSDIKVTTHTVSSIIKMTLDNPDITGPDAWTKSYGYMNCPQSNGPKAHMRWRLQRVVGK